MFWSATERSLALEAQILSTTVPQDTQALVSEARIQAYHADRAGTMTSCASSTAQHVGLL